MFETAAAPDETQVEAFADAARAGVPPLIGDVVKERGLRSP
jgi:hypothetical protein